jgi:hypothetical protein
MNQGFSQFDAERIIDAPRAGVVPPCHLIGLSDGRSTETNRQVMV